MLRAIARIRKIPVFGSYNPGNLNLSSKDFIDGAHVREQALKEVFKDYEQISRK
jgi:hypothetical protein